MPDKRTTERARKDKRAGKAPTTQAGEFVREEIHKIRRGEHVASRELHDVSPGRRRSPMERALVHKIAGTRCAATAIRLTFLSAISKMPPQQH